MTTTPNPTPTTRERAEKNAIQLVANLNINQALSNNYESTFEIIVQAIAAALASERREAGREQMELDCKAVCSMCREAHDGVDGVDAAYFSDEFSWVHKLTLSTHTQSLFGCAAAPIRAAAPGDEKE